MKFKIFVLACLALSVLACREEPQDNPESDSVTLTAFLDDDASSRTMISDGSGRLAWQPGDKIKVFRNSDHKALVLTSTNTEPSSVAEFKASGSDAKGFLDGSALFAVSRANSDIIFDGSYYVVPIPSSQTAVPGSFDPDAMASVAVSENKELHFKPCTGGISFSVSHEGIKKVTLENLSGIDISGNYYLQENGSYHEEKDGASLITLTPKDGGSFKTGTLYSFSLLPWNMKKGFKMTFYTEDGFTTMTTTDKVAVNQGKFTPFPEADKDAVSDIRPILMDLYNALDGPHWTKNNGWGTDLPLTQWDNIVYLPQTGEIRIDFYDIGLKGTIPESIGDLSHLTFLRIYRAPGLTGTLPPSFKHLTKLQYLEITETGITSLPDIFGDMKELEDVRIWFNKDLSGPLPESLGASDKLETLALTGNAFTGAPPASWARLVDHLSLSWNNLSGIIPHEYLEGTHDQVARKLAAILNQNKGYGFDISDIDIPGYWPTGTVEDLDGTTFSFEDVVAGNDYTVYLSWAPWCPISKTFMPRVVEYYQKYHKDGLEIIATVMITENGQVWKDEQKQKETVKENGYDSWHNFYFYPYSFTMGYPASTPQAEVYDKNGNVVFSSFYSYPGPDSHGRFSHAASTDLIPFLETIFGPEEDPDSYVSSDYSQDGMVITLQKAKKGKGINIVFLGNGYTDKDVESGLYESLMRSCTEEFFSIEPYRTLRDRFNVYSVKVVSKHGKTGLGYTTALGSVCTFNSISTGDINKCFEYALKVPGITDKKNLLIGVLDNSPYDGGITTMIESEQSGVAFYASSGNYLSAFGITLRHEAGGHGFGFLDDEYETRSIQAPQEHIDYRNRMYRNYGWYSNVDFTDDPAKVKWSAFLSDERYKDEVGIFEGGSLYLKGAFRPSENSMMRDNYEYFNAPSRWAIYKRIMELSGEQYSFDSFLKYDAINRTAPKKGSAPMRLRKHSAPPVVLP